QGTTDVQCMRLNPKQVMEAGVESALARCLGGTIGPDRYATPQLVARPLADRPRLSLVPPWEGDPPRAAQAAEECVDLIAKVVPGACACVLMADARDRPLAVAAFALTVGAPPTEIALSTDPPEVLWLRYAHIRLA